MKYCKKCGSELKEGAAFCGNCGEKVASTEKAVPSPDANQQTVSYDTAAAIEANAKKVTINIDKEKLNQLSESYFSYFKRTIERPTESFKEKNPINGYIQFVLLALLEALFLYFSTAGTARIYGVEDLITFSMTFQAFLTLLVLNLIGHVVVFAVKKWILKSPASFGVIFTQYTGMFSPVLVIQALLFIFAIITPDGFIGLKATLVSACLVLSWINFNVYLYSSPSKADFDKLYILMIANVILTFAFLLLARGLVSSISDNFFYGLDSLFSFFEYY